MEPFFFGDEGKQLLGLYHPPSGLGNDRGIVICPPILGDYMRTHNCLRQLAIESANAGFHVLRFDYVGTGDSHGKIQDATIDEWQRNIVTASSELREIAGVPRITAFGVRFGATLAIQAADKSPVIDDLFVWDPIISGNDYVSALSRTYHDLISNHNNLSNAEAQEALSYATGYDLKPALLDDVGNLRLADIRHEKSAKVTALFTNKNEFDTAEREDVFDDRLLFEFDCDWDTFTEKVILGLPLVAKIVQRMTS